MAMKTKRDAGVTPSDERDTSAAVPPEAGGDALAGGVPTKYDSSGNIEKQVQINLDKFKGIGNPWELTEEDLAYLTEWRGKLESDQGEISAAREALIVGAAASYMLVLGAQNYLGPRGIMKDRKKQIPQPVIREVLLPALRELRGIVASLGLDRRAKNVNDFDALAIPDE